MPDSTLSRRTLLGRAALAAASLPALTGRGEPAAPSTKPKTPEETLKVLVPPPDSERRWRQTGRDEPALAGFDRMMHAFMTARHISGAALAVTRRSRLVCARGYTWDRAAAPPIQPLTPFRIASLSKPLTAAGVMWLARQGKLRLGDRLLDLVPAAGGREKSDPRLGRVTLRHLLQHQGGWDRDRSFDPMFRDLWVAEAQGCALPIATRDIIHTMAGVPLDFDPGTRYAYSNFGYCLLGRVIEAVTGQDYGRFMRETIFTKLGITRLQLGASLFEQRLAGEPLYRAADQSLHANVRVPGAPRTAAAAYGAWNLENMDAHGGWLATAVDLARFAAAFDMTGGNRLLDKESIEEIFARPATGSDASGAHYGCGWQVRPAGGGRNTWHTGSLPGTFTLLVRRHDGLNWVVLLNQRDDPSKLNHAAIDGLMHRAADAVKSWPGHDLFSEYGL